MRIPVYQVEYDSRRQMMLVKEVEKEFEQTLDCSLHVADCLRECFRMDRLTEEQVILLCMDNALHVSGAFVVAHGTLNMCQIEPRDIFKRALLCNAYRIIVAHNHPSGERMPSIQDREVTRALINAGHIIGIELLEHIIVAGSQHYSFMEESDLIFHR